MEPKTAILIIKKKSINKFYFMAQYNLSIFLDRPSFAFRFSNLFVTFRTALI